MTGPEATVPAGHGETGAPAGYAVRTGDRGVPFAARSDALALRGTVRALASQGRRAGDRR